MSSSKSSVDDILGVFHRHLANRKPIPFWSSQKALNDLEKSWVDVSSVSGSSQSSGMAGTVPPYTISPQISVEDYLRLLREAQRESNQSSARVSLAGSRRDSPRSSPKSPPNSPVQEAPMIVEWQEYYMNSENREDDTDKTHLWIQDWSSRPDQTPPKNWSFRHPKKDVLSIRTAKVGDTNFFSKKGLYALFLTNLISLLLGTGVGVWLTKSGFFVTTVTVK